MITSSKLVKYLFKINFKPLNYRIVSSFNTFHQENQQNNSHRKCKGDFNKFALITGVGVAFGVTFVNFKKGDDKDNGNFGEYKSNLPSYKMSEVVKHKDSTTKIWTTYRQGVYDITDYVQLHPGGKVIMMAAGGSLDPFFNLYPFHKKGYIMQTLESYRIGNLAKEDVRVVDTKDIWADEPERHPSLITRIEKPRNVEPQAQFLVQNYYTPPELFFVRNHHPVPNLDPKSYTLEVKGLGVEGTKTFTLEDVKKMPRHTINCTVMCCGNRRSEMSRVKKIEGLIWGFAAIGNAEWTGVKLSDFLMELNICEHTEAEFVTFEGHDHDVRNIPFGSSMPLLKAVDPRGDVLLAYEMNGEPLTRDHGFPLRLLVPGIAGARSVKWLAKIIISNEETDCHYYKSEYKGFSPNVSKENVDFSTAPAVQELPVISAICEPSDGSEVDLNKENSIVVKGYSYSGGGRKIIRVDVSCTNGEEWHTAKLLDDGKKATRAGQNIWDWTLWEVKIPLTKELGKEFTIIAKAVDNSYSTQPACFRDIWNFRGVANYAYHRIKVKVK